MFRRSASALSNRSCAEAYSYINERTIAGASRWPYKDFVMDRAKGSYVWDKAGERYLDLIMGIGVCNLGHVPDELLPAVHAQVDKAWHLQVNQGFNTNQEKWTELMVKDGGSPNAALPACFDNVFCFTAGNEAVEGAIKVSRNFSPGRPCIAALQGGYHGRTAGAAAITSSKHNLALGCKPQMPGAVFLPAPYHSMRKQDFTRPVAELTAQCLEMIDDILTTQCHFSEVSMLIAEPVMGEGGFVVLPQEYWAGLRSICSKHGILLVADEVQSGMMRTGTIFATEQYGSDMAPDMITFAKGIANGLPLSGLATRKEIGSKAIPGTLGGTYAGNSVAMAASIAALENFYANPVELPKLQANVWSRSEQLVKGMLGIIEKHNLPVDEIRGRGLMLGIEWSRSCTGINVAFMQECYKRKMLLPSTGKFAACRMIPSLRITEAECNDVLAIFEEAAVAALAHETVDKEAVKAATKGGAPVSHFFEDGFLPASPKPDVPIRWVTVRK